MMESDIARVLPMHDASAADLAEHLEQTQRERARAAAAILAGYPCMVVYQDEGKYNASMLCEGTLADGAELIAVAGSVARAMAAEYALQAVDAAEAANPIQT